MLSITGCSPQRPGFALGAVHVGFIAYRVALGQVLLSPVSSVCTHVTSGGWTDSGPLSGRSATETVSPRRNFRSETRLAVTWWHFMNCVKSKFHGTFRDRCCTALLIHACAVALPISLYPYSSVRD